MKQAGCVVTDADRLVAELYAPQEPGARAVAEQFGEQFLDEQGAVNHRALADIVFEDAAQRRKLERLIHPLVGQRFAELVQTNPGAIVVFEATLLVDTGGYRNFDALITVEADPELRIRRAIERGHEESDARARLAAQASEEQRVAVADYVIRNEGDLDDLEERVSEVMSALRERQQQRSTADPSSH